MKIIAAIAVMSTTRIREFKKKNEAAVTVERMSKRRRTDAEIFRCTELSNKTDLPDCRTSTKSMHVGEMASQIFFSMGYPL